MITVKVESTAIASKSGTRKGSDEPWKMNFQQVAIFGAYIDGFPSRHPRETTIQLDENNPQPYPVGDYVIAPDSYYFGDFGRFSLGKIKLQPMAEFLKAVKAYEATAKAA